MLTSRAKRKAIDEFRRDEAQIEDRHLQTRRKTYRTQKNQVKKPMKEFSDVIAIKFEDIQQAATLFKHDIDTGDYELIDQAPKRLPPTHRKWVKEETDRLL